MHGTTFLLAAIAEKLVSAYKAQTAEYQTLFPKPLALGISPDAPATYHDLMDQAKCGKLLVTTEYSSTAIYGLSGNVSFRIFHDLGHILYLRDFSTVEEIELAHKQWRDIEQRIAPEWRELCQVVYLSDTVGQSRYEKTYGKFPDDQRAFLLAELGQYLSTRNTEV